MIRTTTTIYNRETVDAFIERVSKEYAPGIIENNGLIIVMPAAGRLGAVIREIASPCCADVVAYSYWEYTEIPKHYLNQVHAA